MDTNFSCVTELDKRLLPSAPAFDGIHADLARRAAASGTISYRPTRTSADYVVALRNRGWFRNAGF